MYVEGEECSPVSCFSRVAFETRKSSVNPKLMTSQSGKRTERDKYAFDDWENEKESATVRYGLSNMSL